MAAPAAPMATALIPVADSHHLSGGERGQRVPMRYSGLPNPSWKRSTYQGFGSARSAFRPEREFGLRLVSTSLDGVVARGLI